MNILLVSSFESFFQLIGVLLIFVFVLAITWLTTKWMAGYQKKHTINKNLKVIESIRVGNNKYVSIVEAGEVYLVVAIGKDEVTLLTQLTRDQLTDLSFMKEEKSTMNSETFQEMLSHMKDKFPKKQDKDDK